MSAEVIRRPAWLAAEVGALGVVFGDIGTSPLYAFKTALAALGEGPVLVDDVLGLLSLVVWALTLSVTLKYVSVVLRADNDGEGGILALITLLNLHRNPIGRKRILLGVGLFGAAMLFGDGMLTPAISVTVGRRGPRGVHAVDEDARGAADRRHPARLVRQPALRDRGYRPVFRSDYGDLVPGDRCVRSGRDFREPEGVARPQSALRGATARPTYRTRWSNPWRDLSGLDRRRSSLRRPGPFRPHRNHAGLALPRHASDHPQLLRPGGFGPLPPATPPPIPSTSLFRKFAGNGMVVLATAATIIASQAIITGSFSLAKQAVEIGYLPPMGMRYTSHHTQAHVVVPRVNLFLGIGTLGIVVGFGSSDSLASAYGIAVSIAMITTTLLLVAEVQRSWGWKPPLVYLLGAGLLTVDVPFFLANLSKIEDGGWLPLTIGLLIVFLMASWRRGVGRVVEEQLRLSEPLDAFSRREIARGQSPFAASSDLPFARRRHGARRLDPAERAPRHELRQDRDRLGVDRLAPARAGQ